MNLWPVISDVNDKAGVDSHALKHFHKGVINEHLIIVLRNHFPLPILSYILLLTQKSLQHTPLSS